MYREPSISPKAIAWALLSQSVWLPLLAIDAHDRWQSRVQDMAVPLPADPKSSDAAIASLPEATTPSTETATPSGPSRPPTPTPSPAPSTPSCC